MTWLSALTTAVARPEAAMLAVSAGLALGALACALRITD